MNLTPPKKSDSSRAARNTAARLLAVQAVYQAIQLHVPPASLIDEFLKHRVGMDLNAADSDGSDPAFMVVAEDHIFKSIMAGVTERWADLQHMITARVKDNPSGEPLLAAIMICGAYEILAHHDVTTGIIIGDYLDITHGFYTGSEPKLVNAVLDGIAKELRA